MIGVARRRAMDMSASHVQEHPIQEQKLCPDK